MRPDATYVQNGWIWRSWAIVAGRDVTCTAVQMHVGRLVRCRGCRRASLVRMGALKGVRTALGDRQLVLGSSPDLGFAVGLQMLECRSSVIV